MANSTDETRGSALLRTPGWYADLATLEAPDLLVVVDPSLRAVWVSKAIERLLGWDPYEMLGTEVFVLVHPDDLEAAGGALAEATRSDGYHVATRVQVRTAAQDFIHVRITASTVSLEDETWMILALRAVGDEVAIEDRRAQLKGVERLTYVECAAMRWYQDREGGDAMLASISAVLGASTMELGEFDEDGQGIVVRSAWPALSPESDSEDGDQEQADPSVTESRLIPLAPLEELRSKPCVLTTGIHPEALPGLGDEATCVEIWLEGDSGQTGVARLGFPGPPPRWDDANADVVALMCSTMIATLRRCRDERELNERATMDPLTRLLNRSALDARLGELLESDYSGGTGAALLFADLNEFKAINDTFGHREGDLVLRTVAEAIKGSVRGSDSAARVGGDEFVVVINGLNAGVEPVKERLRETIDRALLAWPNMSVAIGAVAIEADSNPGDLLDEADRAMYADKRAKLEHAKAAESRALPVAPAG